MKIITLYKIALFIMITGVLAPLFTQAEYALPEYHVEDISELEIEDNQPLRMFSEIFVLRQMNF